MDSVNVRNLEQIQEEDSTRRSSRLGMLVLASLGGAALVTVGVLTFQASAPPAASQNDALAALVAKARTDGTESAGKLDPSDVTFPKILSDEAKPTTALAAVTDEHGRLAAPAPLPEDDESLRRGPPAAADRLPVVPLPTGTLLSATPVTTEPKDPLTKMAVDRSTLDESAELAPAGHEGGFQIQVASFKEQSDADKFVEDLRKRGHQAYRQAAHVPNRGLWHRVRIGPFKSKFSAMQYKAKFEKTERTSPFIVDPHKVAMQQDLRDARAEARRRRSAGP